MTTKSKRGRPKMAQNEKKVWIGARISPKAQRRIETERRRNPYFTLGKYLSLLIENDER